MSLLLTAACVFMVGVVASVVLARYWDSIATWLNTVAADEVEKMLGIKYRNCIHKAVAFTDRLVNKLRNRAVIYSKENPTDTYFSKTTITAEAKTSTIDDDILSEIEKNDNHIEHTFECKYTN